MLTNGIMIAFFIFPIDCTIGQWLQSSLREVDFYMEAVWFLCWFHIPLAGPQMLPLPPGLGISQYVFLKLRTR